MYFLVGVRNRVSVMLDWFWAYLTYRPSTRLITGAESGRRPPIPAQQIDKAVTAP
jgi:NADH dehydrogenase/putative oxidoreductase